MAAKSQKVAVWILEHPRSSGSLVVLSGLILGLTLQLIFENNLFERFGSLSVAIGVVLFGFLSTELAVRVQGWTTADGDQLPPYDSVSVRKAQKWQVIAAVVGTIQWGFGGLLFLEECAKC